MRVRSQTAVSAPTFLLLLLFSPYSQSVLGPSPNPPLVPLPHDSAVRSSKGAALIIDYGNNECATDTLQVTRILILLLSKAAQAVKNHKFVPVLEEPGGEEEEEEDEMVVEEEEEEEEEKSLMAALGECDLTSHVDFSAIKRSALQDLVSKEDVATVSRIFLLPPALLHSAADGREQHRQGLELGASVPGEALRAGAGSQEEGARTRRRVHVGSGEERRGEEKKARR
eukprot:764814-Hanusia_phi.AAC.4